MVITKLQGGLGNQMFQYAAGFALAARTRQQLAVDTSFLATDPAGQYTKRHLELDQLAVNISIASKKELSDCNKRGFLNIFSQKRFTLLTDSENDMDRFLSVAGNVCLAGYWQSEFYFKAQRPALLRQFRLTDRILMDKVWQVCSGEDTVAVHVRRGDYVTLPAAAQFHGALGMDYYSKAIDLVSSKVNQPRFFVFSDDIEWCRTAFADYKIAAFVGGKNNPPAHDLLMMSACAHQIIANSSYSWWSAWLNDKPGRIVVAPRNWFSEKSWRDRHICPEDWSRL